MPSEYLQIPPGTDLFTIPLETPPLGTVSDFHKRSELLTPTIIICAIVLSLEFLLVASRIYTNLGREGKWNADDWLSIVTTILTTVLAGTFFKLVPRCGHDGWNVSLGFLTAPVTQKFTACQIFFASFSLFLGKLCLLALYYRLFGHIRRVRHQIWFTAICCIPLLVSTVVLPILGSPPPGEHWGFMPHPGSYHALVVVSLATGVVGTFVDLLIFGIPIPVIIGLNLNRRKKSGVLAVFLTGLIAIVADGITIHYRVRLYQRPLNPLAGQIVSLCGFIEAGISVICSSVPSLPKFYKSYILPSRLFRILQPNSSSHKSNSSYYDLPERVEGSKRKKRRTGPYSIPTTHDLEPHMNNADELGLLTASERRGRSVPIVSVLHSPRHPGAGVIRKEVTWEQSSQPIDAAPQNISWH